MPHDHPNVLLVCTDHWPGSLLGCAGHPAVLTPTLDQIARNGVRFSNAYSECPVCVPARRTLMTGLTPWSHGALSNVSRAMPDVPTLAQSFRDHGYQAYAVGKLHVTPQRQRLGFDDVLLDEEGRATEGVGADDYELFLADEGYAGQRFAGGMNNNEYVWRPWHLPEHCHVTNWATRQMARQIKRRDPLRPGFWYLSYSHPHPPLAPLQAYLDMYRDVPIPDPVIGDWARADDAMAAVLQQETNSRGWWNDRPEQIRAIRRAFYALCTHIDHQLRVVIGTLREEGLLENTIVCFTADHGDMLGEHRMWAKHQMYDGSNRVPMLLMGTGPQMNGERVGHHRVDDRLVGLADVMPTLLDLAGLPIPEHVEGQSMVGPDRREQFFGAWADAASPSATRMVRDEQYKLVYYPAGNVVQVFDLQADPREEHDLAGSAPEVRRRLEGLLAGHLSQDPAESAWVQDGRLVGYAGRPYQPGTNRGMLGQRGWHQPPPHAGGAW